MDYWVIRYTDTKNETKFVGILGESEERAVDSFKWFVKEAIEDSITVLTLEEFKDIREAYGLNRDEITEEELTPFQRSIKRIYESPEFQARLASGGYDDY